MTTRARSCLGWLLGVALLPLGSASAFEIDYDPRRPEELRECDTHQQRGRLEQATACYTRLLAASPSALVRAEAAWRLNDVRRANDLFREVVRTAPTSVY